MQRHTGPSETYWVLSWWSSNCFKASVNTLGRVTILSVLFSVPRFLKQKGDRQLLLKKITKLAANETVYLRHHCHRRLIPDLQLLLLHSEVCSPVEEKLLVLTIEEKCTFCYFSFFFPLFPVPKEKQYLRKNWTMCPHYWERNTYCNAAFKCCYLKTFKLRGRKISDS